MGDINSRLIELADKYNISKASEFAEKTGFNHQTASNYLKGRRTPNAEALAVIKQKFDNIDLNWLITGEGEMEEKMVLKETTPDYSLGNMPNVITVDHQGNENILMVPVPAQAGYLHGYEDPQYLQQLPAYRLPKLSNGTFRMFEVKGHSMYPTIHSGAIAVGEWCENWQQDIKDNQIYIVVSKEDGIVIKRCLNRLQKYGNLFAKSDNRAEFPSYPIKLEDIVEVWTLKTAFIFDFQDPADLFNRVSDLEAEMLQLRTFLPAKN
ncbi:transcriptional regulator [Zunongwangia sp. SCSIO 43204]|uniref:XRE family transcriptional regulator n=1 Tax=Zunongwangia sp. SCSIO 43204 TaxID=2779359 RepID=UPI001CA8F450|nr:S24 family peptidase [Zunongwangia sp. SCSIO 43204]UAB85012.1 transcriptional regulator [Zunongwangia sp. SCSIO 43204]